VKSLNRELLDEQIEYYRARAPEYDEWFFRLGRYDRGEPHRRAWFSGVSQVETALGEARPQGRVLDLVPKSGLKWEQESCPWSTAEGSSAHKCAVEDTSICRHFRGIKPGDAILCEYPNAS
jgi:hypothetical protein